MWDNMTREARQNYCLLPLAGEGGRRPDEGRGEISKRSRNPRDVSVSVCAVSICTTRLIPASRTFSRKREKGLTIGAAAAEGFYLLNRSGSRDSRPTIVAHP